MKFTLKNTPLWTSIDEIPYTYPWLSQNKQTQVCIIGSGICAAMCALRFASAGIDTIVLGSGPIGFGSTSFSDGILRTDVAGGLVELSQKVGVDVAAKIFRRCEESLTIIERLVSALGNDCNFSNRENIMYSKNDDLSYDLRKEFLLRKHNGFQADVLKDLEGTKFAMSSGKSCGVVDPFMLTHMIFQAAKKLGAQIYENTGVEEIVTKQEQPVVNTTAQKKVVADKVIISADNNESRFLKNIGSVKTEFLVATTPLSDVAFNQDNAFIATKLDCPDVTFCLTSNNRILAHCTSLTRSIKRHKYILLKKEIMSFFSKIKISDFQFEFSYNYFTTSDRLPVIGENEHYPNCYFNFCAPDDSIIFSEIASDILLNLYLGKKSDLQKVFSLQN